jgi:dUTP pyrophosphatase
MNPLQIEIVCDDNEFIPVRATKGSLGLDLKAKLESDEIVLNPLETVKIKAGFSIAIPDGYHAKIVSRSGMSSKGIIVTNAPGIIDSDYRSDICVLLTNIGKFPYKIENKSRIAQMFFEKNIDTEFVQVTSLNDTERGTGGFGSTGVK